MECEEFILPDWSPPDNPIQSERAKRASSSIMECEEFILPDWSPSDNPARVLAAEGRRNPSNDNDDIKTKMNNVFRYYAIARPLQYHMVITGLQLS